MDIGVEVIRMLESENRCLQKILALSKGYLSIPQTASSSDEIAELSHYLRQRESLFKTLQLFDRRIEHLVTPTSTNLSSLVTEGQRNQIRSLWNQKGHLTESLLRRDQELFLRIRQIQNCLTQEILTSSHSIEKITHFKSNWVQTPGANLDGTL